MGEHSEGLWLGADIPNCGTTLQDIEVWAIAGVGGPPLGNEGRAFSRLFGSSVVHYPQGRSQEVSLGPRIKGFETSFCIQYLL